LFNNLKNCSHYDQWGIKESLNVYFKRLYPFTLGESILTVNIDSHGDYVMIELDRVPSLKESDPLSLK